MTLEEYIYQHATSHWFKSTYNMVILSPVYEERHNLTAMMKIFPKMIWILVIVSIILVTIMVFISNYTRGKITFIIFIFGINNYINIFFKEFFNRMTKKRSILEILLQILSHIFRQTTDKVINKTVLLTIWSVSARCTDLLLLWWSSSIDCQPA